LIEPSSKRKFLPLLGWMPGAAQEDNEGERGSTALGAARDCDRVGEETCPHFFGLLRRERRSFA
jgi:hypothetical protein